MGHTIKEPLVFWLSGRHGYYHNHSNVHETSKNFEIFPTNFLRLWFNTLSRVLQGVEPQVNKIGWKCFKFLEVSHIIWVYDKLCNITDYFVLWLQCYTHSVNNRQRALTPTVSEAHPMTPGQGQEYPVLGHHGYMSLSNAYSKCGHKTK